MLRIGLGQDSHWFENEDKKKPLVLGGVRISESGGLKANSDGDVILHSLCNALSSAIGGDSLGTWADEMFLEKGIKDSKQFIKIIMKRLKDKGFQVVNTAIAIEALRPKISLVDFQRMKKTIGKLLKIDVSAVGITITSGEKITPFGRGEAVQVFSTVLLKADK